jgi:hypothetical protein
MGGLVEFYFAHVHFSQGLRESVMSDFRLAIKLFAGMFSLCAVLAVAVLGIDAWSHIQLAAELIKTFSAIMLSCVTGIIEQNLDEIPTSAHDSASDVGASR